jgi:hypothetical protein
MPVIFRSRGYRFFFYSNEGEPREPLHIHVRRGESLAKIWLEPEPEVAEAYALSAHELNVLLQIAIERKAEIRRYWNAHLGG